MSGFVPGFTVFVAPAGRFVTASVICVSVSVPPFSTSIGVTCGVVLSASLATTVILTSTSLFESSG